MNHQLINNSLFVRCIVALLLFISYTSLNGQNLDSLQQLVNTAKNDSTRIDAMINYARAVDFGEPRLAIKMLDNAEALAAKQKSPFQLTSVYHERAFLFLRNGKKSESLEQLFKARTIIKSIPKEMYNKNMALSYIRTLNGIGMLNYQMEKYDKAIEYFQEGLNYLSERSSLFSTKSKERYLFYFYNNLGSLYLKTQEYPRAEYYLNKAKNLVDMENNIREYAFILNNLSIVANKMGDLPVAVSLVDTAMAICAENNFKKGLAATYNSKGSCCLENGDLQSATDYFLKAFSLSKQNGLGLSGTSALSNLMAVYNKSGQYELAYKYSDLLHQWKDSLRNEEEVRRFTEIEMKDKFSKQLYENKLEQKQIEVAQNRRELIYIITSIASVLGLGIFVLLFQLRMARYKQHKLEAEKHRLLLENLTLDKKNLEEKLEVKNKELVTNVMYMVRKNEMIAKMTESLITAKRSFKNENQLTINRVITELKSTAEDAVWKEFEVRFQQVHINFYEKLNEQFLNLSVNEKKLCAFLRLHMSSKEISAITYQSVNSISVARSRLRKKLGLDADENLISFLETF